MAVYSFDLAPAVSMRPPDTRMRGSEVTWARNVGKSLRTTLRLIGRTGRLTQPAFTLSLILAAPVWVRLADGLSHQSLLAEILWIAWARLTPTVSRTTARAAPASVVISRVASV